MNHTITTACPPRRQRPARARCGIQTIDPDTTHWAHVVARLDHAAAQAASFDPTTVDWDQAACRNRVAQMYPTSGRTPIAALECCNRCPLNNECLIDAVQIEAMQQWNVFGVRAGLSASDRVRWIRHRTQTGEQR